MKPLLILLIVAFFSGCDSADPGPLDSIPVPEPENPVEEIPPKDDYFPLQIGNKWIYDLTYTLSQTSSQDVQYGVQRIDAVGELVWEVIDVEKEDEIDQVLIKETFNGEEVNYWFCRISVTLCPVEEPFEKEVSRSWVDTLLVVSERDSLWFSYLNGRPTPEKIPNVSYPGGTPYTTSSKLIMPRYRAEEPDTIRFWEPHALHDLSGSLIKDLGMPEMKIGCGFLGGPRLLNCTYKIQLVGNELNAAR